MDHAQRGDNGIGHTDTAVIRNVGKRSCPHFEDNVTLLSCFHDVGRVARFRSDQDSVVMVQLVGEGHFRKVKLATNVIVKVGYEHSRIAERKGVAHRVGCGLSYGERRDGET